MLRKFLFFIALCLCTCTYNLVSAQITTGTINGIAKDESGQGLTGAAIKAIHIPTGSVYSTISKSNGQFTLPNLRVGGPYKITIQYVGFTERSFDDLYINLGSPLKLEAQLQSSTTLLGNVKVTAKSKSAIISSEKNGTSTYISTRQMSSLPTISRSVQDFVRLTPQVTTTKSATDGSNTGISFGGQNNRYNQFAIDGANATDGFGLTSSGTNGGQANLNPISIETIQEMQIVMAPYDVTQGGFTGGGINAVTKSGSNAFHGSVYGQYQSQNFVGKSVKYNDNIIRKSYADFTNSTYGASLGGAIIKNKLFFYANVEQYDKTTPLAYDPTVAGSGSLVRVGTLDSLKSYIQNTYGYNVGNYGAIDNTNKSTSIFARLDWNINEKNKLVFRFNNVNGSNDILSRSASSSVFSNGGYKFTDKNTSVVLELNTTLSSNASNVLRFTYSAIRDKRTSSNPFPSVTIYGTGLNNSTAIYNIGTDLSSMVNGLDQDIFTVTDNFTLYRGKHTITFGTDNMIYNSKNLFLQNYFGTYNYGSTSSYAFSNVTNFIANTGLTKYQVNYSTSVEKGDKAPAALNAGQFSVYGQDVWTPNENFKLTYGLRIDMPVFFNKPSENTDFATAFTGWTTNQMPKTSPLFSPRVGFNWDVKGDATMQLRGGAGLFTGRVPFVWISNQYSNTGIASKSATYPTATIPPVTPAGAGIKFNYDPTSPTLGAFIPGSGSPTNINVVDKNFKFPQVFRANVALDQKLPWWGLIGTVELLYTKTVNNANYQNLNLSANGEGTVALGSTTRPLWTKRINPAYTDVIELTNTDKGYAYSLTAQIQKPFSKGWAGSLAYTYGHSTSLSDLTSSVAYSNWRFAYATNGLNHLDLGNSNFNMRSRIVGYVSKEFKYGKNFATTLTLIYNGQSGQSFSYMYSSTITGDDLTGGTNNTLAYIPANVTEANFVDFTGKTASQQWADFQAFSLNNKFLKDNAGKNAARNGDKMPFENHFDVRLAQDFIIGKHKLQIFFDAINVGNLLNEKWGRSYNIGNQSLTLFSTVTSKSQTKDGVAVTTPTTATPAFTFNLNNFTNVDGVVRPYFVSDFTSRWNSQIGLRYSF